jgi:hypothetical protein
MKRILSVFFISVILLQLSLSVFPAKALAQSITPTPTAVPDDKWVSDSEVTFVGKTGVRSREFLDWTLENYSWLCVNKISENNCDNSQNPLIPFWIIIRNIVYALIALFVLGTAFVLIITRGQSITVMRFIPRFIFIIVLITLSFSLVQFIYQIGDIIQGFFLRSNDKYITTQDLLYIGFNYEDFLGFRRVGLKYDESAFISLLLVRLTAITYYVMTGVLLVRKIILWFFIIISPVFPLLIFYRPIRNTAKIWVGEFFRWLLYAPLFAIFLHGLVITWRAGIPLPFDFSRVSAGDIVYPTAINILLGGPGQTIGINNSVNLRDTFALYVVALLMLWVVILLPFLLLKIFLDYLNSISLENSIILKQFMNRSFGFLNPSPGIPPGQPPPPPGLPQPAGVARTLPFFARKSAAPAPLEIKSSVAASVRESSDMLRLANISIPKMRDIARYEASMMSSEVSRQTEISQFHSNLSKIANPSIVAVPTEREKFTTVRQKLVEQRQKGNPIASSVLNASSVMSSSSVVNAASALSATQVTATTISATAKAERLVQNRQSQIAHVTETLKNITNPQVATAPPVQRERIAKMKDQLLREKEKGNTLASSILDAGEKLSSKTVSEDQKTKIENQMLDQLLDEEKKGNTLATALLPGVPQAPKVPRGTSLPSVNRVQQVSLDDYEEVRKLWVENYQTIEPPKGLSGQQVERREWIKNDMDKINQAITLLNSPDPEKVNQGMEMVANILPFLLIGGFSKSEVVAYLKAKMEAGKSVLVDMQKKEEEEESMVETKSKETKAPKELAEEEKIEKPLEENPAVQETTAQEGPKKDK